MHSLNFCSDKFLYKLKIPCMQKILIQSIENGRFSLVSYSSFFVSLISPRAANLCHEISRTLVSFILLCSTNL